MITPKLLNGSLQIFLGGKCLTKGRSAQILEEDLNDILDTKNPKFSKVPFSVHLQRL